MMSILLLYILSFCFLQPVDALPQAMPQIVYPNMQPYPGMMMVPAPGTVKSVNYCS